MLSATVTIEKGAGHLGDVIRIATKNRAQLNVSNGTGNGKFVLYGEAHTAKQRAALNSTIWQIRATVPGAVINAEETTP